VRRKSARKVHSKKEDLFARETSTNTETKTKGGLGRREKKISKGRKGKNGHVFDRGKNC